MVIQKLQQLYLQLSSHDLKILSDLQDVKVGELESLLLNREETLSQIKNELDKILGELSNHPQKEEWISQLALENQKAKSRHQKMDKLLQIAAKVHGAQNPGIRPGSGKGLTISKFNISI